MGRAIWYHIARDLARAIAAGRLRPGGRLPTTREAAERLGVSDRTLRRAYRELHAAGWVEMKPRHGVRVRGPETGGGGAVSARIPGPGDVARLAAVMGLGLNPWGAAEALGRLGACAGYDERLPGAPLSRRRRLWLGHDLRRVVRRARRAGMTMAGIEDLFRAVCEWERYREAVRGGAWVGGLLGAPGPFQQEGRGGVDPVERASRVARGLGGWRGAGAPAEWQKEDDIDPDPGAC